MIAIVVYNWTRNVCPSNEAWQHLRKFRTIYFALSGALYQFVNRFVRINNINWQFDLMISTILWSVAVSQLITFYCQILYDIRFNFQLLPNCFCNGRSCSLVGFMFILFHFFLQRRMNGNACSVNDLN